jgi:hypothetical protein
VTAACSAAGSTTRRTTRRAASAVSHTRTVGSATDIGFAHCADVTASGVDAWAGRSAIVHMRAVAVRKRAIVPVLDATAASVIGGAPHLSRVAVLSKRGAWQNQGAGQAGQKREHCK